ncbi:hypothetical protein GCM10023321_58530 [Pseudonocardia eucalypti]|uniref:Quercetin dioxygenase-like cupin family protein n=1 Tax=Pseudonocardia eucalypti TaxID=648755 RepID=A0ABP9QSX2_9PSEU|nr:hypothetical protein [Pseudonocardia eucalypti]
MSAPTVVLPNHLPQHLLSNWSRNAPRKTAELSNGLEELLADRQALSAWLSWIANDSTQRAQVARASYWHVNGFAKLVLYNTAHVRIRLHIWPAGDERLGESDPHSHRWSFASTVLTGDGLAISEQREAAIGVAHTRYIYDGRQLVTDGCAQLCDAGSYVLTEGDRYITQTRTVHTVKPLGRDLVATLLVQGPHTSSATLVYRPLGTPLPNETTNPMEGQEVRRLITEVNSRLAAEELSR